MQRVSPTLLALILFAAPVGFTEYAGGQAPDYPGKVRLMLPKYIYAVQGLETNIYFDNVILTINSANYAFDAKCAKGMQLAERWTYTPATDDAGDYPILINVRDETNAVLARAQSTVRVAAASAGSGTRISLLAVGDSLTQASVYTQHLLDLCSTGDNPRLVLIGSRGPGDKPPVGENRHEGYSGWTAEAFATLSGPESRSGYFKRPGTGSPFLYTEEDGRSKPDFARYCRDFNGAKPPDFVTFCLGTNDVFRVTDDDIEELIDRILLHYDALIGMVRAFGQNTRIGICLTVPPASSQDGFRNYRGQAGQTRWQDRRNQHRFVERLIARYGNREDENTYLVPLYLTLDGVHSFPKRNSVWHARTAEEGSRIFDGVHPSPEGYRQMADTIYSWVKSCLAH